MAVKKDIAFTKEQLLSANVFRDNRDALNAIIGEDETLTIDEAKDRLNEFMKRKVN